MSIKEDINQKNINNMNVTSFGSCRQHSLADNFNLTTIQEELAYPHYTKEAIQSIEYCKNIHQYDNKWTEICFRSGVLNKKPIQNHEHLVEQFNNTDIFLVEIASRIQYKWNGFYLHHILSEESYNFYDRQNIEISDLTDNEIEEDLLKIRDLLSPKPFIVVSHFYTRKTGKRYELVELLRNLTTKHNIPFIDPMDHLSQYDPREVFLMEPVLSHYTDYGHKLISQVYKSKVDEVLSSSKRKQVEALLVEKSKYPKFRSGTKSDGGYVLADIDNYDAVISCGIDINMDFEVDFLNRYKIEKCYAFDGTINGLPQSDSRIEFHRKNISVDNSYYTTNLHDIIESHENIFIKMDIETYEFRWFETLTEDHLKRIKQMIIEFHFAYSDRHEPNWDQKISIDRKVAVLNKIKETHRLIHFHGNNCCDIVEYDGVKIPNVFECTYIRKDEQEFVGYNSEVLPTMLDYPNVHWSPEITLDSYPFVVR